MDRQTDGAAARTRRLEVLKWVLEEELRRLAPDDEARREDLEHELEDVIHRLQSQSFDRRN